MADAKAMYKVALKEIYESVDGMTLPSGTIDKVTDIYCAAMIASAITNSRDAICARLDAIEKNLKME